MGSDDQNTVSGAQHNTLLEAHAFLWSWLVDNLSIILCWASLITILPL